MSIDPAALANNCGAPIKINLLPKLLSHRKLGAGTFFREKVNLNGKRSADVMENLSERITFCGNRRGVDHRQSNRWPPTRFALSADRPFRITAAVSEGWKLKGHAAKGHEPSIQADDITKGRVKRGTESDGQTSLGNTVENGR